MARENKKVIWAVDPFSEPNLGKAALRVLKNLSKKGYASIQPVFVYSPMILDTPLRVPTAAAEKFRALAQKALDRRVHGSGLTGVKPLKLITENFMTVREQAAELVRFAHENKFSLIVVSTRARKGLQRWMLGSFAETLMLHSDVPLLMVNPSASATVEFKNVVFPTDFSRESRLSFEEAIAFARGFKSRVVLYHRVRQEGTPLFDIAFGGGRLVRNRLMEIRTAYLQKAHRWAELAREAGVQIQVVVDTKPGSPTDGILAQARKTPGMIALAARGGPLHATLLGSTARNVVRASTQPVWVIHPRKHAGKLPKFEARLAGPKKGRDLFTLTEADILHDLPHIPRKRSA